MQGVIVTVVFVTVFNMASGGVLGASVTGFGAADIPEIPLGGSVSTTFLEFPRTDFHRELGSCGEGILH
jgi:hypothetical protein